MTKTEQLDKLARDGEERLLLARALDKLETARRKNIPAATGFLSPSERVSVENLIAASGHPPHLFFGGYPGAERTICLFLPLAGAGGRPGPGDGRRGAGKGPALHVQRRREGSPTGTSWSHPGQGITREKVGDLLVGPGAVTCWCWRSWRTTCCSIWTAPGAPASKPGPFPSPRFLRRRCGSRPSGTRWPRPGWTRWRPVPSPPPLSKAADLISAGRVQLNHRECTKPDKLVEAGDVLSCRGLGRAAVRELGGRSKKGRIMVVLERYP